MGVQMREIYVTSYTMGCPPVRGDNPRALASGLSYVQVDKWYNYFIPPTSHHEIVRSKVGKGGIKTVKHMQISNFAMLSHFVHFLRL